METIDPITLAVVDELLCEIVDEMDLALEETAFSPIISEAHDRTSAMFRYEDASAVAQGERSLPLFMTGMQFMIETCKARFPDMGPGDIVMVNDPYTAGTHLQDVKVCKAVWWDGEPVMYLANAGHWVDIGGSTIGGYCLSATSVHSEGLRLPPTLLYRDGELNEALLDVILANIRIPDVSRGDLMAQVAALHVGERRLLEVFERYGVATIRAVMDELHERSRAMMSQLVGAIPDGVYEAEGFLDNDGLVDQPVRAQITVTVSGDGMVVDFEGSDPATLGPLNASYANTHSGVLIALKHIFPDVPYNGGAFAPVEVRVPSGSFLDARYPQPGSGCSGEVAALVVDVTFRALQRAVPDLVPASTFCTMACTTVGGPRTSDGQPFVLYAFNGAGYSAFRHADGLSHVPGAVGNASIAPIEIVEQRNPVIIERFSLRDDSGGPGRQRGGLGSEMVIRLKGTDAAVSVLADNGIYPVKGADGGHDGAPTEIQFLTDHGPLTAPMITKVDGFELAEGAAVRIRTPGGGGWGDPLERDPDAVLRDVIDGFVSRTQAESTYGVVITDAPDPEVDLAATDALRGNTEAERDIGSASAQHCGDRAG